MKDELDDITHEKGRYNMKDYYEALLAKWLNKATPLSLQQLSSALRAVGYEKHALDLDLKYGTQSHEKCLYTCQALND